MPNLDLVTHMHLLYTKKLYRPMGKMRLLSIKFLVLSFTVILLERLRSCCRNFSGEGIGRRKNWNLKLGRK